MSSNGNFANECQVDLDTAALKVTREPIADNAPELFPKALITGVFPFKYNDSSQYTDQPDQWRYRFDSITAIEIIMADGNNLELELQEITNQPTWSDGTLAGLQQAVTDINTWLAT